MRSVAVTRGCPRDRRGVAARAVAASDRPRQGGRVRAAASDRFACAAQIVRAAGVFAIVPDIAKITVLDPSEGPFFGMSAADIWDFEFRDFGWLGRGITLVRILE